MVFNADIPLHVRIIRVDTEAFVDVAYEPQNIEQDPRLAPLMQKLLAKTLNETEKVLFRELWQERVGKILENFDKVITIK